MESDLICGVCEDDIVSLNQTHSSEPYKKNGLACYPCFIETIAPIRLTIWEMIHHQSEASDEETSEWVKRLRAVVQKTKTFNKEIFETIFNDEMIIQLRQDFLDSKNKEN
jgi:hypothetical protein